MMNRGTDILRTTGFLIFKVRNVFAISALGKEGEDRI